MMISGKKESGGRLTFDSEQRVSTDKGYDVLLRKRA
jgi:hypothetical protein